LLFHIEHHDGFGSANNVYLPGVRQGLMFHIQTLPYFRRRHVSQSVIIRTCCPRASRTVLAGQSANRAGWK
jgi:hypothetical protein